MDVTPQELRGSEIKEAFRGYHRDEVDDLLERAAVTIENLTRQLAEQPARQPTPLAADGPPQVSRDDAETIQRTLLLAQRAADDAVAEAQTRARQILEESEAKAQALVGDAEATARRLHETERRRLESELAELTMRRDRVRADADALEEYANGYRERVRAAIEADLANLGSVIDAPSSRPELHDPPDAPATSMGSDVEARSDASAADATPFSTPDDSTRALSAVAAGALPEPPSAPAAPAAPVASSEPVVPAPPMAADADWPPAPPAANEGELAPPAAWETPAPAAADRGSGEAFSSDVAMEAQPVDTEMLDDDAFFASLRDAVRDDAPLGGIEGGGSSGAFFDDAEPEPTSRRFRRR